MSASGASRPTVLVFATGGTISMRETDAGLAPDPDFPDRLQEMVQEICEPLGIVPRVNVLSPAIDSANADAETAPRVARAVLARIRTQRPNGVVITHGTDTLAFTASRLAFELAETGVPIVVTGSQLPYGADKTDAIENLRLAIRAAARAAPGSPVTVAFGGDLLPAVRSTKHDSLALRAFRAENALGGGPVGVPQGNDAQGSGSAPARVLSFKFTPGVNAVDLAASVGGNPDGLILECYGTGNAPTARPGMIDALRGICQRMPVVAITQCARGWVDLARYATGRELANVGVIDGSDMTVEAATSKLGFLLDRGYRDGDLRELFERNFVGERF